MNGFRPLDAVVLTAYLLATVAGGSYFVFRSRNANAFTSAGGKLPGWLVGLSLFGSFLSSITFLAVPARAYLSDWDYLAFGLSLPVAAWIATRWFVPFYRRGDDVSAYAHFERRFGLWARVYADVLYLILHIVRAATVMYLLALPLNQFFGWPVGATLVGLGALTTVYTCLGGIEGVIWTDAAQSLVLIAGAVTCAVMLPVSVPGGAGGLLHDGFAAGKFSLGSFGPSLSRRTFWVVLLYGLFTNLQNFGIDQTFVQRYRAARSDREAGKSVWISAWLYLPVSVLFLWIGTALWGYYAAGNHPLPASIHDEITGKNKADSVFPYFIAHGLPAGVTGLLIAAVFSGAMSTLSANLNSAATITLSDGYRRFVRPSATNAESMIVLYGSTVAWGTASTFAAIAFARHSGGALDNWWNLAGVFTAGYLGLFLLGLVSKSARSGAAGIGVVGGSLVVGWIALGGTPWLNPLLTVVVGTTAVVVLGLLVVFIGRRSSPDARPVGKVVGHV